MLNDFDVFVVAGMSFKSTSGRTETWNEEGGMIFLSSYFVSLPLTLWKLRWMARLQQPWSEPLLRMNFLNIFFWRLQLISDSYLGYLLVKGGYLYDEV